VGNESEKFRLGVVQDDCARSVLRRRTILQSIAALTMASALSDLVLASDGSGIIGDRKTRPLRIDRQFVLFPINSESLSRRVRLVKNGRVLRSFTASLGLPAQWWAHLDMSDWKGQTLTLSVESDTLPPLGYQPPSGRGDNETDNATLADAVRTSAEIWSPETLYKEPLRPAFHFSSKRGWINDPNGLLYHAGEYHLFFQHNPYGVHWGNMHWGHAVSTDLVHWRELPIVLYPRGDDDFPYSGAGVVDHDNTSGWGKGGRPPMVIAYLSTGRGECIAYSDDDGTTWKEFGGNPVFAKERDPRVLWHPQTKQWVMVVYSERLDGKSIERRDGDNLRPGTRQGIAFYTSPDLKSWTERSWIGEFIDCPDLFALPLDDDANRMKWVLSCGPGYYRIGAFDGSRFIPESAQLPAPTGASSLYAAQTFSNHPDGDVVQIAWGRVDTVDAPFTQLMSFPTRLSLRTTSEGVRLCREPVDAVRLLHIRTYDIPAGPLTSSPLLAELTGEAWDIEAVIRVGTISAITLSIGGDEYTYQPASQMLSGPKGAMPIPLRDGRLQLRILVDRTTVEIFGDIGQAYGMFVRGNPGGNAALELRSWQGHIEKLRAHSLRSIWTAQRG
jgi:fructan beta-fructosidase